VKSLRSCTACPGVVHAGKCYDDKEAGKTFQEIPVYGNTDYWAKGGATGNGTCLCHDPFQGTDQEGKTPCTQGDCPSDYVRTVNISTLLFECYREFNVVSMVDI